jgi:hypothetical protein
MVGILRICDPMINPIRLYHVSGSNLFTNCTLNRSALVYTVFITIQKRAVSGVHLDSRVGVTPKSKHTVCTT